MIDLNIGVSLLLIGGIMFLTFMIASTSCFMGEFERFMFTLLIISVILVAFGIAIISSHMVFI